jgi:hypothetical protein
VECNSCQIPLVDPSELGGTSTPVAGSPRELLANVETGIIPQPHLAAAREFEGMLLDEDIPCFVHAEEADQDVALGSSSVISYGVTIARTDLDKVQAIFQEHFADSLSREGMDATLQTEAVDLDADEVTCPACGNQGALNDGECTDCGLFLGVPD